MQKNHITKNEKASATDDKGVALYHEQQVVFEGAIPHPEILKGYADINADFPERIIQIAENHAKTEDHTQRLLVRGNVISVILGQILSFLFGAVGLAVTVFLGLKGHVVGAVAASITVIVQSVVAAIVNKRKQP